MVYSKENLCQAKANCTWCWRQKLRMSLKAIKPKSASWPWPWALPLASEWYIIGVKTIHVIIIFATSFFHLNHNFSQSCLAFCLVTTCVACRRQKVQAVVDGRGGLFCEIVDDIGMGAQDEIFYFFCCCWKMEKTPEQMLTWVMLKQSCLSRVYDRGWNPTQLCWD